MRPAFRSLTPFLVLLASASTPGSDAEIRAAAESLVDRADALLEDGAPVLAEACCSGTFRLNAPEIRALRGRKFYMLVPISRSPIDVHVQIADDSDAFEYRSVQIFGRSNPGDSLWITSIHSTALKRDDFFLSLNFGAFEARAVGELNGSNVLNWRQNNEYRLLAFRAPLDPNDPAFSLILEDQLLVTLTNVPNPEGRIPTIRPTVSIHPANIGFSMSGGKRLRYKVSVGAGYGLLETTTRGFLRLRIRFK